MSPAVLRGGLIGCGYVSQFHLAGWASQTLGRLAAVCDTDPRKAAVGAEVSRAEPYTSAEAMFAREQLDFVEICTRPESHLPLVQLAARFRVAVLCQKPVAADLPTIDAMQQAIDETGVRMMVHENWRFRPWYVQMANVIREGAIGRVTRLRINAHDFRCLKTGGLDDQPYFAQMPRFILYEMGPHLVDAARHLLGEPKRVYCVVTKAGQQAGEDGAHLVLDYADGRAAILDLCWSTSPHPDDRQEWGLCESVVEGTEGTLRTRRDGRLQLERPDCSTQTIHVDVGEDPRQQSYTAAQAHFLECLANDTPFATSLADNRRAMSIVFAGYASAKAGRVIDLPHG